MFLTIKLRNFQACISQKLRFSARPKSEFSLKNPSTSISQKLICLSARPFKKTSATLYLQFIFTLGWGYWGKRTKFYFLFPLPNKSAWLFPHHNNSSKPTVYASPMPIRTAQFLSSTHQVGEQKYFTIHYSVERIAKFFSLSEWVVLQK